jgi:hypothetical protein
MSFHTIVTHISVDLDAAASVWFAKKFLNRYARVRFVSADCKVEDLQSGEWALDLDCGLKGEHKPDGTVMTCFASLVKHGDNEARQALQPLVEYINMQDTNANAARAFLKDLARDGGIEYGPRFKQIEQTLSVTGLNAVLGAFRTVKRDDGWVCDQMGIVFDGLLRNLISRMYAAEEARNHEIYEDGPFKVAIVRNSEYGGVNAVMFDDYGVDFVIYIDDNDLGIVRRDGVTVPTSAGLAGVPEDERHEWFVHPAGFLTARGTRKAPAKTPSKAHPSEIAQALIAALAAA